MGVEVKPAVIDVKVNSTRKILNLQQKEKLMK
jgi:hypothetical protein